MTQAQVFVVDDLDSNREMIRRLLDPKRFAVETFDSVLGCLDALGRSHPDAIVTDIRMPGIDGIEGLRRFRELAPEVPVVMVTAYASIDTAIDAMKRGAFDYLKKPFEPGELEVAIDRAVRHRALVRENRELKSRVSDLVGRTIVTRSAAMREVIDLIAKVAQTEATVLIQGESGTGKEVIAREIHARSRRAGGRFLAVNCAAIPETLFESELFGYERGAFTGADRPKKGLFESAAGGTLLLDEVGEMPLAMQPKLLRVLQDGEFYPVGARDPRQADARLIFASNRDLEHEVQEHRFREDLLYRVRVFVIRVPPLRERADDIEPLVQHFVRKCSARLGFRDPPGVTPAFTARLHAYPWPGNVRELENAIERSLLVAEDGVLDEDALPPEVRGALVRPPAAAPPQPGAGPAASFAIPLEGGFAAAREAFERAYFTALLEAARGNVSRAAEIGGVHRSTLYEKLAKLGIAHAAATR